MINAPVIRAVQDVLQERGLEQKPDERLGDYVARGLGVSDAQAEVFIQCVHDGASIDEAQAQAGIQVESGDQTLLTELAKAIGVALGRVTSS